MNVVTISQARSNLYHLVDDTSTNHQPTFIKGKRNNVILVGEEDWRSIQEKNVLRRLDSGLENSFYPTSR